MANGQLKLFRPQERTTFDANAVAEHIAAHASGNPYAEQERRRRGINARKTGTYAPEDVPEHLQETMALTEEHFRQTAPGSLAVSATKPEIPEDTREAIDKGRQRLIAQGLRESHGRLVKDTSPKSITPESGWFTERIER